MEAVASKPLTDNLFFVSSFDGLTQLEPSLVETLCDLSSKLTVMCFTNLAFHYISCVLSF